VADRVDQLASEHALPVPALTNMQVVLDEALSNIVLHAPAAAQGVTPGATVRVWLTLDETDFAAEIEDDGPPFDPTRAPPPVARGGLAERPIGGLGLHLMHRLCKTMEYRRECGMNRLRLVVPLHAP
jgi:anti-sigma regulatory factor (Ser/Thr protein kinase)